MLFEARMIMKENKEYWLNVYYNASYLVRIDDQMMQQALDVAKIFLVWKWWRLIGRRNIWCQTLYEPWILIIILFNMFSLSLLGLPLSDGLIHLINCRQWLIPLHLILSWILRLTHLQSQRKGPNYFLSCYGWEGNHLDVFEAESSHQCFRRFYPGNEWPIKLDSRVSFVTHSVVTEICKIPWLIQPTATRVKTRIIHHQIDR